MSLLPNRKMETFCLKYNLEKEAMDDLSQLFDDCMVHVAKHLLCLPIPEDTVTKKKNKKTNENRVKCKGHTKKGTNCTYYALEGLDFCKRHSKNNNNNENENDNDNENDNENETKCHGLVRGKQCNQAGTLVTPEGAKFTYCCKHKKKWEKYEGTVIDEDILSIAVATPLPDDDEDIMTTTISSSSILTPTQEEERIANGLTEEEFIKADANYKIIEEKVAIDGEEALNQWKKDMELPEKEIRKILTVSPKSKKTQKRPNSWIKKQRELKAKQNLKKKARNQEMLGLNDNENYTQ
jgi:hypothetical protein